MNSHRILLFVALSAVSAQSGAQTNAPLQIRDVLGIRRFADRVQVDLSPDGKFVAYTVQSPARAVARGGSVSRYFTGTGVSLAFRGSDVYVTDVLSAKASAVPGNNGSSWSPVWSPDGRTLAFLSDRDGQVRVWLWNRQLRQLRRLAAEPVRTYFGFESIRWSPNGRRIAVKLSPARMTRAQLDALLPLSPTPAASRVTVDDAAITAKVFDASAGRDTAVAQPPLAVSLDSTRSFLNTELADLAIIDVRSGRVKRVAPHVRVIGWHWAPDGSRLAFTTRQPDGGRGLLVYDNYDLFVVDTSGKQPQRLVAPRMVQEYGQTFSWSPNSRTIAFESSNALHVVSREGGDIRRLDGGDRQFTEPYRAPLWLSDDALLAKSADTLWRIPVPTGSASLIAASNDRRLLEFVASADAQRVPRRTVAVAVNDPVTKASGFRMYDLASGVMVARLEEESALGGTDLAYNLDVSADGKTSAYVAERSDRPPEVVITQDQLTHSTRVTNINPQVTRLALGGTKLIQWTGPQGEILRGALLMPSNYEPGRRFPLVVKVYGGTRPSNRLNRFGLEPGIDNVQLLATRGYGVLLPDAPLRVGTPLGDLGATVLPGVDSVIAIGLADPTRLAIMGHSYGGYSVLAILVQTNRFKAAISSGGFSNLFSQYGEMREDGSAVGIGWSERDQGRMGGTPWEFRDRYIENSPFFFLDRVRTPVLLLHGGADRTVLAARAAETFVGLRRLGREVMFVRYEGEDHHPGTWSVANATDYWERIFAWLDRYMVIR
jgi:dipeptidyl aminopeptidase/acylaminoacyl peptidase